MTHRTMDVFGTLISSHISDLQECVLWYLLRNISHIFLVFFINMNFLQSFPWPIGTGMHIWCISTDAHVMQQCILILQSSGQNLMDGCAELSELPYLIAAMWVVGNKEKPTSQNFLLLGKMGLHGCSYILQATSVFLIGGQTWKVFRHYTVICPSPCKMLTLK